ncbi:MAG: TrmH family RNA methyltransferase [Actinomycetota bacterium]
MHFETIDDPNDSRLVDYIGLTDPQIRRRQLDEQFFIAEGIETVKRLIRSQIECRSIVIAPNRLTAMHDVLEEVRCPVYMAERHVVSEIVGFDLHRGVIASGHRPTAASLTDVLSRPPRLGARHRLAVLHGVNDHENVGAIVRSARAFHIDALVLDPTCADPYYRRSVRVSMGEIFFLPVIHSPVTEFLDQLRHFGGTSMAFTPRSNAESVENLGPSSGPFALIFGSEGFGLPEEVLSAAETCVRIPIASDVDSLNVGHAASVAFALTAQL